MKFKEFASVAILLMIAGCVLPFQVWNEDALMKLRTVAVVPIAVGAEQKDLLNSYFPRFQSEFTKAFAGRISLVPAETVRKQIEESAGGPDRDFTWEFMAEVGRQLQADAVIGLLIEESDTPGKLIEHIKVVGVASGKILASNNFLIKSSSQHSFRQEISELKTIFRDNKKAD